MADVTPKNEKSDKGRNFVVKITQVGPWREGHVFCEKEFKRLNPLLDNQQTRDAGMFDEDAEPYHETLLKRLLDNGSIVHAPPDAVDMPTEPGPENRTKVPKRIDPEKKDEPQTGTRVVDVEKKNDGRR